MSTTQNLLLPLLDVAQGSKELTVNTALTLIDAAFAGLATTLATNILGIGTTASTSTITLSTDSATSLMLKLVDNPIGTMPADQTLSLPLAVRPWLVINSTSNPLLLANPGFASIPLASGFVHSIVCDGSRFYAAK